MGRTLGGCRHLLESSADHDATRRLSLASVSHGTSADQMRAAPERTYEFGVGAEGEHVLQEVVGESEQQARVRRPAATPSAPLPDDLLRPIAREVEVRDSQGLSPRS